MTHSQVGGDREQQLAQAVDEFFDAVADGETPKVSDYLRRYPEIAGQLKIVIPAMLATERAAIRSAPTSPQSAIPREKQLGDFRILRQLGRGGMGVVYEAEQISMQRRVALKVLPLAGLVDAAKIRRFQNEVRAVAALDHPNIVSVYMVGEERGVHFFAMKLIRGRSLSEIISSLRSLRNEGEDLDGASMSEVARIDGADDDAHAEKEVDPVRGGVAKEDSRGRHGGKDARLLETVDQRESSTIPHATRREYYRSVAALGIQAAAALQHAHDEGIIHRDIKPANLLLDSSSRLYLTDFGLARIEADAGVTMTGDLIGTLRYMPPEQALGKRIVLDHRADIYSLGATLYELLSLEPTYRAEDRRQLLKAIAFEEPTPLRRIDPDIPGDLQTIVHKAMSKDTAQRYASAQEMADDLRSLLENRPIKAKPPTTIDVIAKWMRRNPVATTATAIIVLAVTMSLLLVLRERGRFTNRDESAKTAENALQRERWTRTQAFPAIRRLIEEGKFVDALSLAEEAERLVPRDANLAKMWPEFTLDASIMSDPIGVDVCLREWSATDDAWKYVGRTPMPHVRLPQGQFHWKLSKPGYETLLLLRQAGRQMGFKLEKAESMPAGMVRVTGGNTYLLLRSISQTGRLAVGDFLIDKYEVTNRRFQEFVDQGGYSTPRFWKHPFVKGDGQLPREDAMAQFIDATGQPGPAGWRSGRFPEGRGDYPVRGISWFEAAAYAEFVGKRLPSVYHWARAADLWSATYIIPLSNFGMEGPAPAGFHLGVGGNGAFDMAGNVKEWCWNEAGGGKRYILGGAWNEPQYMFNDPDDQSPYARLETNGFRCVKVLVEDTTSPKIDDEIIRHRRNFNEETPASDSEFAIYKSLYSYDKAAPLNPVVSVPQEREGYWYERVEFDAGYGEERITAHFYRPSHAKPPYQTVIYFPPAHTLFQERFDTASLSWQIAFFVENGRAVLYPIYKGTYERQTPLPSSNPAATPQYRDHVLAWSKDLGRSIDYLTTRSDVEHEKLAYYGYSLGGVVGVILLAVEDRIKVAILSTAGLCEPETFPVVSQINFAPRVAIPVLMLNGRYNTFFPVETAVRPMFELLGAPSRDKRLGLFDSGQFIPQQDLTRESVDWLNKYLGTVKLIE